MSTCRQPYYEAYEDRYRRVYAQGVACWTGDPEEIGTVISQVDEFLDGAGVTSASGAIIEFGCGEGFVGEHLLRKGYSYLGIDLSDAALQKARARVPGMESSFLRADVTNMPDLPSATFTAALDNYCLHMLVTDKDRSRYLAEVFRALTPGGRAWFREIGQRDPFTDRIDSFEEFLARHPTDLRTCEPREAYTQAGRKVIQLPRLPARFNNCEGYQEEFRAAGFEIEFAGQKKGGIVIHARKADRFDERLQPA